jgi:signal transduction histidine kinase
LQEPLRKIKTFISIIQTKLYNEAAVKKYLEKINASASRMSELIKALLNYSRPANEEGVRVATDLNIVLQNVLVDFELLIEEKNASIHSGLLPVINAMPLHMNQLFANLISNSLKFSQGAVSVEIHARNVSGEQIINNPGNLPHARYLEISVADNGIGFEQQYEKRVFIMFQRLHGKSEYSGTGIGLALCKKIIDAHNGFITVRSDIGRGTTFYLYFPQEEDPQKK